MTLTLHCRSGVTESLPVKHDTSRPTLGQNYSWCTCERLSEAILWVLTWLTCKHLPGLRKGHIYTHRGLSREYKQLPSHQDIRAGTAVPVNLLSTDIGNFFLHPLTAGAAYIQVFYFFISTLVPHFKYVKDKM